MYQTFMFIVSIVFFLPLNGQTISASKIKEYQIRKANTYFIDTNEVKHIVESHYFDERGLRYQVTIFNYTDPESDTLMVTYNVYDSVGRLTTKLIKFKQNELKTLYRYPKKNHTTETHYRNGEINGEYLVVKKERANKIIIKVYEYGKLYSTTVTKKKKNRKIVTNKSCQKQPEYIIIDMSIISELNEDDTPVKITQYFLLEGEKVRMTKEITYDNANFEVSKCGTGHIYRGNANDCIYFEYVKR